MRDLIWSFVCCCCRSSSSSDNDDEAEGEEEDESEAERYSVNYISKENLKPPLLPHHSLVSVYLNNLMRPLFLRNPRGKKEDCKGGGGEGSTDFFDHSLKILYFRRGRVRFGSERS